MSYSMIDPFSPRWTENVPAQAFQITPLNTGQILDRSITLYRSNFKLLAGLAVFPAVVGLLFGLAQVGYLLLTHTPLNWTSEQPFTTSYMVSVFIALIGWVAQLCVYGISVAASTWCVARLYLNETASIKAGFDYAFRKWLSYLMLTVAQIWFAAWMPTCFLFLAFALVGILAAANLPPAVLGFSFIVLFLGYCGWLVWNFIRVSLAIPVCVIEGKTIGASVRRSRALMATRKIRVFLLFLFLVALQMNFLSILAPLLIFLPRLGPNGELLTQVGSLVISFLYGVLVSPVAAVALCLFYFDERSRREGFDIEYLMSRATPPPPVPEAPIYS